MSKTTKKKLASSDIFIEQLKSNDESIDLSNSFNVKDITVYDNEKIYSLELNKLEPAPIEWNFYKPLSPDKMQELVESILNNGLLTPIIVWENNNGSYMILAGHNRVAAHKLLVDELNYDEFNKIPAIIKAKDAISIDDAKQIIIDTNWVIRNLSPIEKHKSITEKYKFIEKNKKIYKGKPIRETVANYFEISGRQISNYLAINKLVPEIKYMFDNNEITLKKAAKIARFDEKLQEEIYKEDKNILTGKYLKDVNKDMTIGEIIRLVNKIAVKKKETAFKIECNKEDKETIIELLNEYLTTKGFDVNIVNIIVGFCGINKSVRIF